MTQIKDIGSTIEPIINRNDYPAEFDSFVVLYASVKKTGWRKFHKMVVKVPAVRRELSEINKSEVINIAMNKMKMTLGQTKEEPN